MNVDIAREISNWEIVLRTLSSRNVFIIGWIEEYPDPDYYLRVGVRSLVPHWRNDQYNQLLEDAERIVDQSERIRLYQQADKILIEEAVVMPIAYNKEHFLCKPWVKLQGGGTNLRFKDVILEPH